MRAEVRSFFCWETDHLEDPEDFAPEDPDDWQILIQVFIGTEGEPGEEQFDIVMCTRKRHASQNPGLEEPALFEGETRFVNPGTARKPSIGARYLLVTRYDWAAVTRLLTERITEIEGDDWDSIAERIDRFAAWEGSGLRERRSPRFDGYENPVPTAFRHLGSPPPPEVNSG